MRTRSTTTPPDSVTPTCWQREAPSACLRVEMPSGELHLFSYQHFVTASLQRSAAGTEMLRIAFSDHELQVEGHGLRDLLLGLQDFAVKWLRTVPERYLPARVDGVITAIQIIAVVEET